MLYQVYCILDSAAFSCQDGIRSYFLDHAFEFFFGIYFIFND